MTHEEFLIEAQLFYYNEHMDLVDSVTIFDLIKDDVKLLIIKNILEERCQFAHHELKWVVENHSELLEEAFEIILNECPPIERLTEEEIDILGEEWAVKYFNFAQKFLEEVGETAIWKKYFQKDYKLWISKLRDKKIDQILND